jgi:hypothetical protein
MKNKIALIPVITSLMCAVMPYNPCQAANEPLVVREYITKKSEGITRSQEKVTASYEELRIENGFYAKIRFQAANGYVVKECQVALTKGEELRDELLLDISDLRGVTHATIELVGPDSNFSGIKVPFEIK